MTNKILIIGIIIFILLVIGSFFISLKNINITGNVVKEKNFKNSELEKYRSQEIPEECRKPEGQSLEQWKEHLGHHQETLYCLEYFKNP